MAPLPVEVLLGIYLGVLTGILPALVAWGMGFLFKYLTGVTIPGFGVVVMALALAGVNGGLLALTDESITQGTTGPVIVTAIIVVLMLSLYAHAKGDAMGAAFPKRISLQALRERTLSADVIEFVGGHGQATVTVVGEVADMEGYPPLTPEIRQGIKDGQWRFPAELSIGELETRFSERLRTEFELTDVSVSLDERARASVAAAPPLSGLSKRVPVAHRAVSVETLVPTGVARGDLVQVTTSEGMVEGTLVSARSSGSTTPKPATPESTVDNSIPSPPAAATTKGGDGRMTVAVPRSEVATLLSTERARVTVRSRGVHREYELVSLLRRAGKRFRKLTIDAESPLVGTTLGGVSLREEYGVAVLAVRRASGWTIAPRGSNEFAAGDELAVVGSRDALLGLAEVVR